MVKLKFYVSFWNVLFWKSKLQVRTPLDLYTEVLQPGTRPKPWAENWPERPLKEKIGTLRNPQKYTYLSRLLSAVQVVAGKRRRVDDGGVASGHGGHEGHEGHEGDESNLAGLLARKHRIVMILSF